MHLLREAASGLGRELVPVPEREGGADHLHPKHVALRTFLDLPDVFDRASDGLVMESGACLSEFAGHEEGVEPELSAGTKAEFERQACAMFQADLQGNLGERWLVSAGIALMDPEVTRSNTVSGGIPIEGKTPQNAPETQANLWTVYDLGNGFEIGGGAFHTGKRYADAPNLKRIDAYTRWDAYAAWRHESLRIALNAYNLGDEQYVDYAHPAFVTWGEPRNVRLSVSYSF